MMIHDTQNFFFRKSIKITKFMSIHACKHDLFICVCFPYLQVHKKLSSQQMNNANIKYKTKICYFAAFEDWESSCGFAGYLWFMRLVHEFDIFGS